MLRVKLAQLFRNGIEFGTPGGGDGGGGRVGGVQRSWLAVVVAVTAIGKIVLPFLIVFPELAVRTARPIEDLAWRPVDRNHANQRKTMRRRVEWVSKT